ncbi:hypothetical protein [Salmonella phage SD-1_S14]|nr:hypothetical protein [Salmonella phage SD-1_S14]
MLPFGRIITSSKKNIQPSVTKIASSDTTVFALMSDGTLYSRGSQEFGQMGIGNIIGTTDMTLYSKYTLCSQITNTYTVKDYTTNSSYFAFAIANNNSTNKLFAYHGGGQYFGQLANGSTSQTYISLRQTTQAPGDIIRSSVGYSYFSNHIITSLGVYATGNNTGDNAGQLGIGTQTDV